MPSTVSKLLPQTPTVTVPVEGAIHFHQTDEPPSPPPCHGSSVSFVASTDEALVDVGSPLRRIAFAKRSFAGAAAVAVAGRTSKAAQTAVHTRPRATSRRI